MFLIINRSKFSTESTLVLLLVIYEAGSLDRIDDPDPDVTWTPPKNEAEFKEFSAGANYSGLLYAGKVEFNWIVDLRVPDRDQEEWATGNLVSFLHILTTCRAVDLLQKVGDDGRDKVHDPDTQWEVEVYRNTPTYVWIYYCENYLWESSTLGGGDRRSVGHRFVKKVVRHPNCSKKTLAFDAAIIVMDTPILAYEPKVGYMPTAFDYIHGETKEMVKLDLDSPITFRTPVCYVASFGRNYVNHKEFYVLDFKVKYRVYLIKWEECADKWRYVCNTDSDLGHCSDDALRRQGRDYLMCMRPRAKVGTVCDHDRGAPLVCNGQVIGLVVHGAQFSHCNNRYKIPFIVEKLQHVRAFLDESVKYVVRPVPMKEGDRTKTVAPAVTPKGRASFYGALKALHISSLSLLYMKQYR